MIEVNPLLLTGAVIGTITALLIAAYVLVKDKKSQMGFEPSGSLCKAVLEAVCTGIVPDDVFNRL